MFHLEPTPSPLKVIDGQSFNNKSSTLILNFTELNYDPEEDCGTSSSESDYDDEEVTTDGGAKEFERLVNDLVASSGLDVSPDRVKFEVSKGETLEEILER